MQITKGQLKRIIAEETRRMDEVGWGRHDDLEPEESYRDPLLDEIIKFAYKLTGRNRFYSDPKALAKLLEKAADQIRRSGMPKSDD